MLDFFIELKDLFFISKLLIDDFGDFKFDITRLELIISIIKRVKVLLAHLIKWCFGVGFRLRTGFFALEKLEEKAFQVLEFGSKRCQFWVKLGIFFLEIRVLLLVVGNERLCSFDRLSIVLVFLSEWLHEGAEVVFGGSLMVELAEFWRIRVLMSFNLMTRVVVFVGLLSIGLSWKWVCDSWVVRFGHWDSAFYYFFQL